MKSFLPGKTYLQIVKCICIVIMVVSCNSRADKPDHVEVQQNFRHIGYVATSLSWGHIHSTLKFNQLKHAVRGTRNCVRISGRFAGALLRIKQPQDVSQTKKTSVPGHCNCIGTL